MPQVKAPANVLVTGGSGFIGAWVIRKLLDKQYSVRAVVRTSSKGEYLRDLFAADHPGKFEFIIIPDIQVVDAFSDAMEGIHAVQHIASPVGGDPDKVVDAAVNGTISMLKTVIKYGKQVQRVVVTSSGAAVMEPKPYPCVYTEVDWNLSAPAALNNGNTTPVQKYHAAKTLSERAAWDFVKGKAFDLATILPTYVIGPIIHEVPSLDKLNYSSALFYNGILHERASGAIFGNWVDVRDVADAHVCAMEAISGQRFITSAGAASWQLIYDTLNALVPPLKGIPIGQSGKTEEGMPLYTFRSDNIQTLGLSRFITLAQSARDSVLSMREHGW